MPEQTRVDVELVGDYLERLRALNYSPFTLIQYRLALKRFFQTYPDVSLEKLTPEHIERHIFALRVSPRTKDHMLGYLKSFFAYLVTHKRLLKTNPCDGAERPRWKPRIRWSPTFEAVECMYGACRTLEEQVVLNLYFQNAVRLREGMGLRVRHVLLDDRSLLIEKGKGEKDRFTLFDPAEIPPAMLLAPLLKRFIAGRPREDWLFASPRYAGARRSFEWLHGVFEYLSGEAKLPYCVTAHLLRHAWARWARTCGLSLDMIAEQLGHSSVVTTQKMYGKVDLRDRRTAMDRALTPLRRD